nr:uncharacterized protein LOC127300571 [Lolium perenne]
MKTPQNTSKRVWSVREAGFGPFRPDETGRNPSGWGGTKTRATPRVSAWRREGDVGEREEDDAGRRSKTTPPPKLPPRSKTTPPTLPPLRKQVAWTDFLVILKGTSMFLRGLSRAELVPYSTSCSFSTSLRTMCLSTSNFSICFMSPKNGL